MLSINLRKATTKEDAINLFYWKNDEIVRKFSIVTKDFISFETHIEWLEENIEFIKIIEVDGLPVGDIRIKDDEIAIKIAKLSRGKGIGKKVIEMVKYKGLKAKIVEDNQPSLNLFLGAGFKLQMLNKGVFTLEYE